MDTPSRISCVHCYQSFSRGTLLVLLMSGLVYAVHWLVYSSIALSLPENFRFLLDCAHPAFYVLLPVTGWVAESMARKISSYCYRIVIHYSSCIILSCFVSHAAVSMVFQFVYCIHTGWYFVGSWYSWHWDLLHYYAAIHS